MENNPHQIIDKFTKESGYGFLSNFHVGTIFVDGLPYLTVEHAYQAHKTFDESSRELIRRAKTPGDAKRLGRCVQLRSDWDEVKITLMKKFLIEKFKNPFLRPLLLETGDAKLINENIWHDKFWGTCNGVGLNWLGRILMEVRQEIREEEKELQKFNFGGVDNALKTSDHR